MVQKIQIKRGNKSSLPTLDAGELAFCIDTKELFVGHDDGINVKVTMQDLVGMLSDLRTNARDSIVNSINELTQKTYALSNLSDVDVTSKSNGYAIQFDSISGKFKSLPLPSGTGSGATNLDGLSDVDVTTTPPIEGNYLKFVSGIWQPASSVGNLSADVWVPGTTVQPSNPVASADPITFVTSNLTKTSLTLSWSNGGSYDIVSYNVYKNGILLGNVDVYTHSINISGLVANTSYTMKITSINDAGIESTGATTTVTTSPWGLALNQTIDGQYITTPSLTFSEVIIDFSVPSTESGAYLLDARNGLSLSAITFSNGILNCGAYWSAAYLNGVQQTTLTSIAIPNNTRVSLRVTHTGTSGTNLMSAFAQTSGFTNTFMTGILYAITIKNQGTLVAQYDIANGTLNDISGNGHTATLNGGGTWI